MCPYACVGMCMRAYTHVSRTLYSGFVLPRKQPETPTPAHLLSRFRVTGLPWSVPTDLSLRHTPLYMAESVRAGVGVLRPTDRPGHGHTLTPVSSQFASQHELPRGDTN